MPSEIALVQEGYTSCINVHKVHKERWLPLYHYYTLQEHQWILTNATISKDSDMISISVTMAVYEIIFFFIFQVNLRNQEIVYLHDITEKYYKIGRSELC